MVETVAHVEKEWVKYGSMISSNEEMKLHQEFATNWKTFQESVTETIDAMKTNHPEKIEEAINASHAVFEKARPALSNWLKLMNSMRNMQKHRLYLRMKADKNSVLLSRL